MGCSSIDSIKTYQPNLTQVFAPKTVTPVLGWNTHVLDVPYDWDGVSNVVIDICFSNTTNGAINNKMTYTTTAFPSTWFTASNAISQCGITGTVPTPNLGVFNRPNFQFSICVPNLDNANITWTPNTGPNAPNPLNNDTVIAAPIQNTTYTATVTSNGCAGNDFVFIKVDTSLKINVTPDTFICSVVPIRLNAAVTGSPLPGNQFTYNWTASVGAAPPSGVGASFASPTVNPTQATVYTCIVTGGSCLLRDTANVVVGSSIPISLRIDSIRCFGQTNEK